MSDFPKYPTDFAAMTTPFEDEDIERLLGQDVKKVAETIDILKHREVNATTGYQNLKDKINALIDSKREEQTNIPTHDNYYGILQDQINELISLL